MLAFSTNTSSTTLSISLFCTVYPFSIRCYMLSSSIHVCLFCFSINLCWFICWCCLLNWACHLGYFPSIFCIYLLLHLHWGVPLPCDSRTWLQCNPLVSIFVWYLFFLCWYLPNLVWKDPFERDLVGLATTAGWEGKSVANFFTSAWLLTEGHAPFKPMRQVMQSMNSLYFY